MALRGELWVKTSHSPTGYADRSLFDFRFGSGITKFYRSEGISFALLTLHKELAEAICGYFLSVRVWMLIP